MSKSTVLTLVGSLRAESTNQKLAEAIQLNAPEQVDVVIHDSLGNIPHCAPLPVRPTRCCSSRRSTTAPCPPR
jgi:NAD(P)H-dependent FMN reductase